MAGGGGSELGEQGSVLNVQESTKQRLQKKLEEELKRIQGKMGLAGHLEVAWIPNVNNVLSGEVKGNDILIYERDEDKALDTLCHEVVDYCVSQVIEPYKELVNNIIKMINKDAYKRKEKVVDALTRLITGDLHR